MRRGRGRGIALISALFFVLIVAMVVRGILALSPANLRLADSSYDDMMARRAAEAGQAYARARLNEDTSWKGLGNGIIVNTQELQVIEDNGNVLGLLHDVNGTASMFRLRFNYQDGGGGGDGLADPSANHRIDHIYCSVNNLLGQSVVKVPLADRGTFVVTNPAASTITTAPASACLQIEGRVGPAIAAMRNADDPLPPGQVYSRYIRVGMVRGQPIPVADAPIMAGGGIDATSPLGMNVTVVGAPILPKLRSKKGIKVSDGAPTRLYCPGILGRDPALGVTAVLAGTPKFVDERVGDTKDFLNLKWTDLPTITDPAAVKLMGGTYVFWPDGTCHYYDMNFPAYKATISTTNTTFTIPSTTLTFLAPTDPGTPLAADFQPARQDTNTAGIVLTSPVLTTVTNASTFYVSNSLRTTNVNVTADLQVVPSASGVKGICFTDLDGRPLYPSDTRYSLPSTNPNSLVLDATNTTSYQNVVGMSINGTTMACDGDIEFLVNLDAQDSTIMSAGNIVVCSSYVNIRQTSATTGVLTTAIGASRKLSFYAKKDLLFSSYQKATAGSFYNDMNLEGMLYACGNITCYQDDPFASVTRMGKLTLRGAMIGYGADPITGKPGSGGGGAVQIWTNFADMILDVQKLGGSDLFDDSTPQANLVRYFYAVIND